MTTDKCKQNCCIWHNKEFFVYKLGFTHRGAMALPLP